MNRIVTISREFGSDGKVIGKMTAEKLGIKCYDDELITRIAQETGFAEDFIREHSEYTSGRNWFENALVTHDYNGHTLLDGIWGIQTAVIKEIAERESAVIVGRCADYILRGKADLLTVFIHADKETRISRISALFNESPAASEKRLRDMDKRRKAYYQTYTDMKWGDLHNYHICLDSGTFGPEKCVEIICSLY